MRKRSIPLDVLERIEQHRPHLKPAIDNLLAGRVPAVQAEKFIADNYLSGETRLSALETWHLSACCVGHAYGSPAGRSAPESS